MKKNYINLILKGNIINVLIVLALPSILSLLVSDFYNIYNTHFTARYIGKTGLSGLSITYNFFLLFIAISYLFSTGVQVLVSKNIGENNLNEAKKIATTAIIYAVFAGIIIGVLGIFSLNFFLKLFSTPDNLFATVKPYMLISFLGLPIILSYFTLFGIYIALGEIKFTLYMSTIFAVINIITVPFWLSKSPSLETLAWINVLASLTVDLIMLYFLKKHPIFTLKKSDISFELKRLFKITYIGSAYFIPFIFHILANNTIIYYINQLHNDNILILWGTTYRIYMFFYMIMIGLRQSTMSIFSINHGALQLDRIKFIYIKTVQLIFIISLPIIILVALFSSPIMNWQLHNINILHQNNTLILMMIALPIYGFITVTLGFLQATQKIKTTIFFDILDKIIFVIIGYILTQYFSSYAIFTIFILTGGIIAITLGYYIVVSKHILKKSLI